MTVSEEVLEAKLQWLPSRYKGKWKKSTDIDHSDAAIVTRKNLYTAAEKKRIKPNDTCAIIYLESNSVADKVAKFLKETYKRKVKEVPYDGNCMYAAVCCQISRNVNRYKGKQLKQQASYFLAKYPEKFKILVAGVVCDESLESYVRNQFHDLSYGDYLMLAVIAIMFNLTITIVRPDLSVINLFHNSKKPSIVVVFNGKDGLSGHYCGTIGIEDKWVPVKGDNFSFEIKNLSNAAKSSKDAEVHFHEVQRRELKEDYDFTFDSLNQNLDKAMKVRSTIDEMEEKLQLVVKDCKDLETKLLLTRTKLLALGVKSTNFERRKTFDISGFKPKFPLTPSHNVSVPVQAHISSSTDTILQIPSPTPTTTPSTTPTVAQTHVEGDKHTSTTETVTPVEIFSDDSITEVASITTNTTPNVATSFGPFTPSSVPQVGPFTPIMSATQQQHTFQQPQQAFFQRATVPQATPPPLPQAPPSLHVASPFSAGGSVNVGHGNIIVTGGDFRFGKPLKNPYVHKCPNCEKMFTKSGDRNRHMLNSVKCNKGIKNFHCDRCDKKYANKQSLLDHISNEHTKEARYTCLYCGEKFLNNNAVVNHRRTCIRRHYNPDLGDINLDDVFFDKDANP